jgi:hypothetical protein
MVLGARYAFRFTKETAPTGCETAYRVTHEGNVIGYVASQKIRPIVPRGGRPRMRSGSSPVTRWFAATTLDALDGRVEIDTDQRHDAAEQLLEMRRRG